MIKKKFRLSLLATIGVFLLVSSCNSKDTSTKNLAHEESTMISHDDSNAI